jgi:hypothetical protein
MLYHPAGRSSGRIFGWISTQPSGASGLGSETPRHHDALRRVQHLLWGAVFPITILPNAAPGDDGRTHLRCDRNFDAVNGSQAVTTFT